jgi:hypothetical protein
MIHILGSVEHGQCFYSISFLKDKVCNHLNPHWQLVVAMYAQRFFTLDNFPCATTVEMWAKVHTPNGRDQYE